MKKLVACLLFVLVLAGCGKTEYKTGMFTDVDSGVWYEGAVKLAMNEGYIEPLGDSFGVNEPVTLSECADIAVRLAGVKTSNPIKHVVENSIAPKDFEEWDAPAARGTVAYMLANLLEEEAVNPVVDGAISDVEGTYAKDAIYKLYRMGIFSGGEEKGIFRPFENITRAEMAIVIERICDRSKRARFDMGKLSVSFIAFGDTIGHEPVLKAGATGTGYDFTELFENVKGYIEEADVACINQETVFVESGFTGYPSFGSPKEIGIAQVKAGFDVITHATNHAFDRGVSGVLYTTGFWESYNDIVMLGIHQNEADAQEIEVIEKNGIKIALLNYTYSLNGYRLPIGKEYMVDLLNEDKIKQDMARAREMSDAIVVFAHWGNEYQNTPAQSQRNWAQLFADEGATVIVGAHPHVVQPLENVQSADGRIVPVYYSLGNFISNQNDYQNALCAMADFEIVKDESGVWAENCAIEPVVTHMEAGCYSAYLLKDYPEEKAVRHKHKGTYGNRFTVDNYLEVFNNIVG